MKHLLLLLTLVIFVFSSNAQFIGPAPLIVPGDNYAFAYSNTGTVAGLTTFGLYFNETGALPGFEFRGAGGAKLVNVQSIASGGRVPGDITFGNTGSLIIGPNRYAFRFSLTNTYGLFFNAADFQYEFRTADASPVLSIEANTGEVSARGPITGNDNGTFVDFAVKGLGGGLTNGYLGVQGANDFDGEDSLDIAGDEIGVLGVSTGGFTPDNTGVYGFSNGTAVRAVNQLNDNTVSLANETNAIEATGDATIDGNLSATGGISTDGNLFVSGVVGVGQPSTSTLGVDVRPASGSATIRLKSANSLAAMVLDKSSISENAYIIHRTNSVNDWYVGTIGNGNYSISQNFSTPDGQFTMTKSGLVGINTTFPSSLADLTIGTSSDAVLQLGSAERLSDGGANTMVINVDFDPDDLFNDLGQNGGNYWDDVNADDFINLSDRREKSNIAELEYTLDDVMKLRPVSYTMNDDQQQETKLGLIAQEVLQVIPEAVKTHDLQQDEEGNIAIVALERMGMRYNNLIPVLIAAVQEQQETIEKKDERVHALEEKVKEIDQLKEQLARLDESLTQCCLDHSNKAHEPHINNGTDGPWLGQNIPNPFDAGTIIRYYIPESVQISEIKIFDTTGKEVKNYRLQNGYGEVQFNDDLQSGTYLYSLINDHKVIATKKMIMN